MADGSVSDIAPAGVAAAKPDRDQIARLAYSYWEARGCVGGSPEEDWYRAEQELQAAAGLAEGEPARLGTEE